MAKLRVLQNKTFKCRHHQYLSNTERVVKGERGGCCDPKSARSLAWVEIYEGTFRDWMPQPCKFMATHITQPSY
ncbi:unnamed protein product [Enterobius vermicularis]|uniref:Uncharacterized protein n=1 Tax=Enterobius vermicularis TaxID=51028 RepID=A0A0N4UVR2_ENTVE|nr:unnamed protein product [Enterobius vermicularis]